MDMWRGLLWRRRRPASQMKWRRTSYESRHGWARRRQTMRRQPRGWPLHGGRHREVQTWRRQRGDARIQTRNTKQHDFNVSGWLTSQTTHKFVLQSGLYAHLDVCCWWLAPEFMVMFTQWGHGKQRLMCKVKTNYFFSPTSFTVSRSQLLFNLIYLFLKNILVPETSTDFQTSPVILQRTYAFMEKKNLISSKWQIYRRDCLWSESRLTVLTVTFLRHHIFVMSVYTSFITYLSRRYDEATKGKKR